MKSRPQLNQIVCVVSVVLIACSAKDDDGGGDSTCASSGCSAEDDLDEDLEHDLANDGSDIGKADTGLRAGDPANRPGGSGACDVRLGSIFGGPGAIAAGSGYEPTGFSSQMPAGLNGLDRSQAVGPKPNDWGHLFGYAMHLYASPLGVGRTGLYIPPGFTRSTPPSGKDAVSLFYYPKLGDRTDVTLAVYHVRDFEVRTSDRNESGSIRIGTIAGPGRGLVRLLPLSSRGAPRVGVCRLWSAANATASSSSKWSAPNLAPPPIDPLEAGPCNPRVPEIGFPGSPNEGPFHCKGARLIQMPSEKPLRGAARGPWNSRHLQIP